MREIKSARQEHFDTDLIANDKYSYKGYFDVLYRDWESRAYPEVSERYCTVPASIYFGG